MLQSLCKAANELLRDPPSVLGAWQLAFHPSAFNVALSNFH